MWVWFYCSSACQVCHHPSFLICFEELVVDVFFQSYHFGEQVLILVSYFGDSTPFLWVFIFFSFFGKCAISNLFWIVFLFWIVCYFKFNLSFPMLWSPLLNIHMGSYFYHCPDLNLFLYYGLRDLLLDQRHTIIGIFKFLNLHMFSFFHFFDGL